MTPLTPTLCVLPPSLPRAVLICGMRHGLSSCIPSATLYGNSTWATRGSFRFLLFALLGELVLTMIGGRNAVDGADSRDIGGIGVKSPTLRCRGPLKSTKSRVMKSPLRLACCCYVGQWRWGRRRRWALWERQGHLPCRRRHFGRSPRRRVRRGGRGR